jgi:LacI family transcriptional regulator
VGTNRFADQTPTITDVAAASGVSVTTVSHALSGRRPVSPATQRKVQDAVTALGYRPNQLARSMRTQKSMTIALVIPDITNPFYPEVARGVQDLLSANGYQLFICNTDGNVDAERAYLADAIDRRVDGVIVAPIAPSDKTSIAAVLAAEIAVVQLAADLNAGARAASDSMIDYVHSDDRRGTAMATAYLLDKGHSRIGFINGPLDTGPAGRRQAGYLDALTERNIEPDKALIVSGPFTRVGGLNGLPKLLDHSSPPTAVICANDLIAIGALDVAHHRGMAVPDDIAIVGFDDIEAASLVSPPLTTVVNPAREIGHACARLLLDRISGSYDSAAREVLISTTLIPRASA